MVDQGDHVSVPAEGAQPAAPEQDGTAALSSSQATLMQVDASTESPPAPGTLGATPSASELGASVLSVSGSLDLPGNDGPPAYRSPSPAAVDSAEQSLLSMSAGGLSTSELAPSAPPVPNPAAPMPAREGSQLSQQGPRSRPGSAIPGKQASMSLSLTGSLGMSTESLGSGQAASAAAPIAPPPTLPAAKEGSKATLSLEPSQASLPMSMSMEPSKASVAAVKQPSKEPSKTSVAREPSRASVAKEASRAPVGEEHSKVFGTIPLESSKASSGLFGSGALDEYDEPPGKAARAQSTTSSVRSASQAAAPVVKQAAPEPSADASLSISMSMSTSVLRSAQASQRSVAASSSSPPPAAATQPAPSAQASTASSRGSASTAAAAAAAKARSAAPAVAASTAGSDPDGGYEDEGFDDEVVEDVEGEEVPSSPPQTSSPPAAAAAAAAAQAKTPSTACSHRASSSFQAAVASPLPEPAAEASASGLSSTSLIAPSQASAKRRSTPPTPASVACASGTSTPVFKGLPQHTPADSYADSFDEGASMATASTHGTPIYNQASVSDIPSARPSSNGVRPAAPAVFGSPVYGGVAVSPGTRANAATASSGGGPGRHSMDISTEMTPQSLFRRVKPAGQAGSRPGSMAGSVAPSASGMVPAASMLSHTSASHHPSANGFARPLSATTHGSPGPGYAAAAAAVVSELQSDDWEGQVLVGPVPPAGRRPVSARPASAHPAHPTATMYGGTGGSPPMALPPRPSSVASFASSSHTGGTPAGAGGGMPRGRPMSAGPRDRQGVTLSQLLQRNPLSWDSRDVAQWVDCIGMGQYRRKFLHNCIDGRLLLRLSDQQLKAEIGIGPMGHCVTLMEAIEQLAGAAAGASGSVSPEHYPYGANRGSRSPSASPERHGNGGHAMAWDTPVRPQRPLSAAPPTRASPAEAPRRPASASPNVLPPDAFLGPALGKVTVYEQRAKLLFELDRAMARAAQQNAAASQLMHHASTTSSEVEHLRGLLSDLERKNRAAFAGTTGRGTQPRPSSANTLDTKARIPWSHIGKGTKLKSWDPVRIGQPGDPETVDMTFQPRISTTSKRMLSEGAGGCAGADFLARLSASERKRTQAKSELERKYFAQAVGAGDGNGDSAMRQFERDFELIRRECESKQLGRLPREADRYEPMIDIMLDNLDQGTVRESGARLKPVRAAKGPAKVTAAAGVLRTIQFMDRYRNDVNGRNRREKELQDKWMRQTLGEAYLPGAKDKQDASQAVSFFAMLGWREDENEGITDHRLDALLNRAVVYQEAYKNWWDKTSDKPGERAAGFACGITWHNTSPFASDGLASAMDAENRRTGAQGGADVGGTSDVTQAGGPDYVTSTVRLLARCRMDDLYKLKDKAGDAKTLAVYRAIRTQQFIDSTETDASGRQKRLQKLYEEMAPKRKIMSSQQIEGFFDRLLDDAGRRRERLEKALHDKVAKEHEILKSSVMFSKARRPKSAR